MNKDKSLVSKLTAVGGTIIIVLFNSITPTYADKPTKALGRGFNNRARINMNRISYFFKNLF